MTTPEGAAMMARVFDRSGMTELEDEEPILARVLSSPMVEVLAPYFPEPFRDLADMERVSGYDYVPGEEYLVEVWTAVVRALRLLIPQVQVLIETDEGEVT